MIHRPLRPQRRRQRGQAMTEFVLTLPILLLFSMGTYDLGSWVAQQGSLRGQARAGLRAGERSASADIGDSVRKEGASAIPNTVAAWGNEFYGGTQASCLGTNSACGDSQGCARSSSFWTTYGSGSTTYPTACFAITTCTLTGGTSPTCTLGGSWQTRPSSGVGHTLLVVVVAHKYVPASGILSSVVGAQVFASYQVESEVSY